MDTSGVHLQEKAQGLLQAFLSTALVLLTLPPFVYGDESRRPLALVNGIPIFPSDLDCAIEATHFDEATAQKSVSPDAPGQVAGSVTKAALERVLTIELLYQESLKHRYPGLSAEVEERYRREMDRIGGESKLQAALRCNDMTPESFRKALFRNLSIGRLLESAVYSRIFVSDDEARSFYRDNIPSFQEPVAVRLRQVFIKVPSWTDANAVSLARTRAEQIAAEASMGSDFAFLARRFSDDPSGGSRGGDMGLIRQGALGHPFEAEIFSLPSQGVTPPIQSRSGFHIYKVIERYPQSSRPYEEVKGEVISQLRRMKAETMIHELVESLRAKADIRIHQQ